MFFMPSIIGTIQLVNVGGGVVNFGDTLNIAPKTNTKTFEGSGSSNVGGFIVTNNGLSTTNTLDSDAVDQPSGQNDGV
jgi:spore germination protein PF